jgi:phosphoribosylformimino-5-aminoimidazole carboxamide ribotide isomerase
VSFTVIPAIDVRDGRVVRLRQGDFAQQTTYESSPLALARRYEQSGARWLHLVDLDAARDGHYALDALLSALCTTTAMRVQTGGGVRRAADIERLLNLGASRVVVGTAAVRAPERAIEWLREYGPERLVLALDVREDGHGGWCLPVEGWTAASSGSLDALLERFADAGLRHVLCTDIGRDGMLAGFNLALYARLATRWPSLSLQASGGVRDAGDVAAARAAGAGAAILGRALLEDRLALAQVLAC